MVLRQAVAAFDRRLLLRKGRVLEKNVLVTAVRAHVEDRIIVYESKCVVFGE